MRLRFGFGATACISTRKGRSQYDLITVFRRPPWAPIKDHRSIGRLGLGLEQPPSPQGQVSRSIDTLTNPRAAHPPSRAGVFHLDLDDGRSSKMIRVGPRREWGRHGRLEPVRRRPDPRRRVPANHSSSGGRSRAPDESVRAPHRVRSEIGRDFHRS